ncbi:uncharacterized protein [Euwallacea similis]|uniref:uncharacterized protein n=1 Tax=Euwallacea similis TaxID=1736056 RepID=UPI00344D5F78
MGRGKTISLEIRKIIIERLGVHKSIVSRIIYKFRQTGSEAAVKNSGRTRKTTKRTDKWIIRMCQKNPFLSSTHIKSHLEETGLGHISSKTIRRRLVENGLFGR